MVARAKKPKINWNCLGGKKKAIKGDKKIFHKEEVREDEGLVYIYFTRR